MTKKNLKTYQLTRKEKNFIKFKEDFDNGLLSHDQFTHIDRKHQIEYLKKELNKKYKKNINFSCSHCAEQLFFDIRAEISDDELAPLRYTKTK